MWFSCMDGGRKEGLLLLTLIFDITNFEQEYQLWTITKSLLSRLDAFEMWIYRRVLKISWTKKITNEKVLKIGH